MGLPKIVHASEINFFEIVRYRQQVQYTLSVLGLIEIIYKSVSYCFQVPYFTFDETARVFLSNMKILLFCGNVMFILYLNIELFCLFVCLFCFCFLKHL